MSYCWKTLCSIVGVSGRNSAPLLVSMGGIVPQRCCQWEEKCLNIDVMTSVAVGGSNGALFLESVEAVVPHYWCH
ncbi:unnamed protein product [Staurois parvus]|uniref:Uncharacterized protein n=1 Tax=Staurois parvus TaxID=386267 RepID=A0ABN9EIM4_9NEOB|nr:unnamed protein product [Staurois parvus]